LFDKRKEFKTMQHAEGMSDLSELNLNEIRGLAPSLYTEPVDPQRTALVIVDMQGPQASYTEWMDSTIANNQRLLAVFREQKLRIVHVVLGCWTKDGAELAPHYKRNDARKRALGLELRRHIDLPENQIFPELAPRRGEIVLQKVTPSAFASTGLDCILRNMGIQYLVMSGKITHGCLGSTALDACYQYGYSVTMVSDASIAPTEPTAHKAWLRLFGQHWGRVRSTDGVIQEIRARCSESRPAGSARRAVWRGGRRGGDTGAVGEVQAMRRADDVIDLDEIQGLGPCLYTEPVDPKKTALIIVAMQKALCRGDAVRSTGVAQAVGADPQVTWEEWMNSVIANNCRLLDACRKERLRIVHIVLGCWTEDGAELAPYYKRADEWLRGLDLAPRRQGYLPQLQTIPELAPQRGEIVLQKVTPSAFASTGLDCILRNMDVQYVILGGNVTHGWDASYHYGYSVTMVSDASMASTEASHKAWLRLFAAHPGRVRSTDEVIQEIRARRS
jgi:nicotinamidase-related amidase